MNMLNKTPKARDVKTESALRLLIVVGLVLLTFLGSLLFGGNQNNTIKLGNQRFTYKALKTFEEVTTGLGNETSLPKRQVILFTFDQPDAYCFWMKDMKFSIDILWLDESKKVIEIKEDVAPETYPELFCPNGPAKYVVETNAGTAKSAGVSVDDTVSF